MTNAKFNFTIDVICCGDSEYPINYYVFIISCLDRGLEGNENTIYWRCNVGVFVDEILSIPISNPNKQQALRSIAQLYLSAQEVSRRQVTGTLSSNSLLLTAVSVLTLPNDEKQTSTSNKKSKNLSETVSLICYYCLYPLNYTLNLLCKFMI